MHDNRRGLTVRVNHADASIEASATHLTLLDFLRTRGLTGAKEGCAEGECGACTVVLVTPRGHGSEYRAVNSCLVPLPLAAGYDVLTVEALASGALLEDAQRALAEAGGSQCGYCTPGFVMSLFAEQYRPGRSGPCAIEALAGNLCRCTGYRPIRDAALSLELPRAGALLDRLREPTPPLDELRGDRFARPTILSDLLDLLQQRPDATLVAGATDLAVDMNLRGRRPPFLVSIEAIPELRTFQHTPSSLTVGAALPLTDLGRAWPEAPAAVHEWLELFASPLIRNRATLGGSLATASPIGDSAPLLAALDAVVHLASARGRRSVSVAEFFTGYRTTGLEPGEVVIAVDIPKPLPQHLRFYKVSKRRLDDISTVAAAFSVVLDADARVQRVRLALGGVAATPIRLQAAEQMLVGSHWDIHTVRRVQDVAVRTLAPIGDHRGSREYRLAVTASLIEKFWWETRP